MACGIAGLAFPGNLFSASGMNTCRCAFPSAKGSKMRPRNSISRWFAAAICVLATSGFVAAEEGVVRISATNGKAGVVQMHASAGGSVQHAALDSATVFNSYRYGGATPAQEVFGGY